MWADFAALIDPLRWPQAGLESTRAREIRTMKARVEAERLPRGADPRTHLKLGRGGLTDVEWTVQLLTLRHAHAMPTLRVTSTLAGLDALRATDLLTPDDHETLRTAYELASALRNATMLWRGRPSDAVPADVRDADGVGRIIGREPGTGAGLVEAYLRQARHTRQVVERLLYEAS